MEIVNCPIVQLALLLPIKMELYTTHYNNICEVAFALCDDLIFYVLGGWMYGWMDG